jgi:hypothetical protein
MSGCSKKSDPDANQPSKTDQISASTWKVEDMGSDQNRDGVIEQSVLGAFACLEDNSISFRRDNTGTTDEGTNKCNASSPQTTTINWNFADNETHLVVSNSPFKEINGRSKILDLTATNLVLTRDTVFMGTTVPFVVKLKH